MRSIVYLLISVILLNHRCSTEALRGATTTTTTVTNSKWILTQHPPNGEYFQADQHCDMIQEEIELNDNDDILIQVETLAIDAFLRTLLYEKTRNAVHGSLATSVGETIPAMGVGKVIHVPPDNDENELRPGDWVCGLLGGQTYCRLPPSKVKFMVQKIESSTDDGVGSTSFLTHMGVSGEAAYMGMHNTLVGSPQKGDTVLVSAAAGATGSLAVQYAQQCGAKRVVGVTRSAKVSWLKDTVGVDAVVDYLSPTATVEEQLAKACPDGVDFFFDNVGGELLDTVLTHMNVRGRVVMCGAISQYNHAPEQDDGSSPTTSSQPQRVGLKHIVKVAERSCTMTGLNLFHFSPDERKQAKMEIEKYAQEGKVKCPTHRLEGIESFGVAFEMLFRGENRGKMLVDITKNPK